MQPATVAFFDQRVVMDRALRIPVLVRLSGRFVGHGVDGHEVATMQQWLAQAAFHALDRFVQPLSELPRQRAFWSAEVAQLVAPLFAQRFLAKGTVEILAVEILPAPSPQPTAPPAAQPAAPSARAPQPVAPVAPVAPVPEPISEGPVATLDPWELTLDPVIDAPTKESVRPIALVAYTGAPLAPHRTEPAKRLAVESVCESITRAGAEGRSVLDLLLYAGGLDEVAAARFSAQAPERLRARGSIAVREVRLSQEDAAKLRDLYAQIAAARGG
jgi:hypothetical protein